VQLTVLGAGSWGTALAILLARNGHEVTLYGRDDEEIQAMSSIRENMAYLPGFVLPPGVSCVSNAEDIGETDAWIVAVPSTSVRAVAGLIRGSDPLVVVASKGLETGTSMLLSRVVKEVIPGARIGALSGPNLAIEIVRGIPTAAVCAFPDAADAERIRAAFMCRTFRVYVSDDIIGVELAGSLKNVLAIAAGLCDGLGFGDNTKGALLARGLHEMTSLGLAMGARIDTFLGVAGVGDLFATAVSTLSRNYRVGRSLGTGASLSDALHQVGQVAEGVGTSESVMVLARRYGIPMPTFEAIEAVIRGRVRPNDAVQMLMERSPRTEAILRLGTGVEEPNVQ
jgi:glycerol-3-phosphate dehydrogenase (NAD(P)+)